MKLILITVIASAAIVAAPAAAHADDDTGIDYEGTQLVAPPTDWTNATYDEWIWNLDPVSCTFTIDSWHYERDAVYNDAGDIESFGPWYDPVLMSSDFGGNGTLDDCADWVENEDGSTSYVPPTPAPIVVQLPVDHPSDGIIWKKGING